MAPSQITKLTSDFFWQFFEIKKNSEDLSDLLVNCFYFIIPLTQNDAMMIGGLSSIVHEKKMLR